MVNTSLLGSETCEALLGRHPEAEFAATYWERDGRRHWSLRSRADGDFDVSQIALKRGGGGHPHAAGFTEEPGPVGTDEPGRLRVPAGAVAVPLERS